MGEAKLGQYEGKSIHYSVGAVILRGDNVLLIDRAKPPYGLAGPAGHVDEEDKNEEVALVREVKEETGLNVVSHKLLIEEFVPWNQCSKGVLGHYWYLYRAEVSGAMVANPDEAKSIGWRNLKTVPNLETIWEYWFEELIKRDKI